MRLVCLVLVLYFIQIGGTAGGLVEQFSQKLHTKQTRPQKEDEPLAEIQIAENAFDDTKYQDCEDVRYNGGYTESGLYEVYLNTSTTYQVNCNFDGDVTRAVITMQKYGRVSFAQPWYRYESGFGSLTSGDFWAGLKTMQALTRSGANVLTVTLQDWTHDIRVIQYRYFSVGPPFDRYRLKIGKYVSSHVLPDDFSHNNGAEFATYDRPDTHACAVHQHAGWWYNYCTLTLPTGKYYPGGHYKPKPGKFYDGIYYKDWQGFGYSLKYIKLELSKF